MGLVPDVVRLIFQIHATETVVTTAAVFQKPGITTTFDAHQKESSVIRTDYDTVITKLVCDGFPQVKTVFQEETVYTISRVFHFVAVETKIAVLEITGLVTIIGIDHLLDAFRRPRHLVQEFAELLEKRTRKIVIPAVGERVPSVGLPILQIYNFRLNLRREIGENFFAGNRVFPPEKPAVVPPNPAPEHPALRAKGRRRDIHFFIKIEVFGFNNKIFLTTPTNFIFPIHV